MNAKLLLIGISLLSTIGYTTPTEKLFKDVDFLYKEKKERKAHFEHKPFSHLNLSAGVSTLGLTLEGATPLANHVKLRAGVNFFNFNSDRYSLNLDDPNGSFYEAFGLTPELELQGKINLFHAHVLVDYYPFKKGILFFSAGAYVGNTKIMAKGNLTDSTGKLVELLNGQDWPTLAFDGHILNTNGGKVDAELKLGNAIKPYFGIGLGRAVSKRRLGVKFEMGVLYQGDYSISQAGQQVITGDQAIAYVEDAEKYTRWLKWWPKVSLQVSYRLF